MPWSKVAILGVVIPPLIGIAYNWYIKPYYWVDDHPLLYGNNGSLDPIAHMIQLHSRFTQRVSPHFGAWDEVFLVHTKTVTEDEDL